MRRKPGSLVPLERAILSAALRLRAAGTPNFHGFQMAREIQHEPNTRLLTASGSLYKAFTRLEQAGYLTSLWEDPMIAADEKRPRRRYYHVTAAGAVALATSELAAQ